MRLSILLLVALATGCQSQGQSISQSQPQRAAGGGGLYVYTDAQGNLVTLERPVTSDKTAASNGSTGSADSATSQKTPNRGSSGRESVEDYRPSAEVDQELEARENDRFISYVDETGQLVSRPLDMGAEREAASSAPAPYETLDADAYLETYRALRADCCQHLLAEAQSLESGKEALLAFGADTPVLVGESAYRARIYSFPDEVSRVSLMAFIRKQGYLAVELLWLDKDGLPVMLVDQPFSRKYPETWYRYGYLQGTVEKEPGQYYLVVFLPYFESRPGTDGLKQVTEGELVLTAP